MNRHGDAIMTSQLLPRLPSSLGGYRESVRRGGLYSAAQLLVCHSYRLYRGLAFTCAMDEIFAETSKETVKELSLLSLTEIPTETMLGEVTSDGSSCVSLCSSDLEFLDTWYGDCASDTALLDDSVDFEDDVYRIVENETQIINGAMAWPPLGPQPSSGKTKGRFSKFLARFKARRPRDKQKFAVCASRDQGEECLRKHSEVTTDPQQLGTVAVGHVAPTGKEVRSDDAVFPRLHSYSEDVSHMCQKVQPASGQQNSFPLSRSNVTYQEEVTLKRNKHGKKVRQSGTTNGSYIYSARAGKRKRGAGKA